MDTSGEDPDRLTAIECPENTPYDMICDLAYCLVSYHIDLGVVFILPIFISTFRLVLGSSDTNHFLFCSFADVWLTTAR